MSQTPRLGLPLMAGEQAQKHVTHNEALLALEGAVQLVLTAHALTTPPQQPEIGAVYGVGSAPEGAWAGHAGALALWSAGGWRFCAPGEGWRAWDLSQACALVFREGAWRDAHQQLARVGVGTKADGPNALAVRGEAALFTAAEAAEGGAGDVRLTLNKQTENDSATLLFQSGFSGRAEIGLAGDAAFAFKVSANGIDFTTPLTLDPNGFVRVNAVLGAKPDFPAVSDGTIAAKSSVITPQPESATSESIATITGGFDGALLVVTGKAGATLTLAHGTGNLRLGADRVLKGANDTLTLVRRGPDWLALSHAENG